MKRLLIMLTVLASFVWVTCQNPINDEGKGTPEVPNTPETPNNPQVPETPAQKYAKEYWGEWLRMDTGEKWYISGGSITINGREWESSKTPALTKQSSRVVEVREDGRAYYLYASRVANASFTGRVEAFDQSPLPHSAAGGRAAAGGKGWIDVVVKDLDNGSSTTVKTDGDGKFTVPESIPGDDYQVIPQGGTPVVVTPAGDGDDVGTITISSGLNFKTSIKPKSNTTDMTRLYANMNAYELIIVVENTGTIDCTAATFQLDFDDGLALESVPASQILGTIEPGKKKEIPVTVRCSQIQNEYEYKKIGVTITDPISDREWQDSVSLKWHRGRVNFNIKANHAVSGVIIAPTAQAYSFRDVTSATLTMPWSVRDYLVVFSGATADTEVVYSLGIDVTPDSDFNAFSDTGNYEPNNTENNSSSIAAQSKIMSYLHKNDIDYYKVSLGSSVPVFKPAAMTDFAIKEAANGNGDNKANPHETHYLDIRVKNNVNAALKITSVVLSSESGNVTIDNGTGAIGDLNAGSYKTLTDDSSSYSSASSADLMYTSGLAKAFKFTISESCPVGTGILFTVTFTDSWGNTWTDTLTIQVTGTGANIAINTPTASNIAIKEAANGNGDNQVNPRETHYLDIRAKNSGTSKALGVTAVLTAASSYVTIDKGTGAIGDLRAGYYKTLTYSSSASSSSSVSLMYTSGLAKAFKFTILPNCPAGTSIPFTVTFTDSWGNTWTDTLSVYVNY